MRLVVTRIAEAQIREASDWWLENREAAPALFHQELRNAFELVVSQPTSGSSATNVELAGVRRVLMKRCRYHLYYRTGDDVVEVLGLWHMSRGSSPEL